MAPQPALLTRDDAARYLGVSYKTLERWAAEGRGPKITRIGGRPKYRRADLDEYLEKGERRG